MLYRRFAAATSISLAALCVFGAVAVPPVRADNTPAHSSGKVVIPERTEVILELMEDLKSGETKEDSEVPFEVKRDVTTSDGALLIKAGTHAYGKVTQSQRRGAFGKAGKLEFSCDYILMPDNTHVPLRAEKQTTYGQDNRTATVATAILVAPVALLIHGRDVTVDKGKTFTMYVDHSTAYKTSGSAAEASSSTASSQSSRSVYALGNGKVVIGSLVSFDGTAYTVATESGKETLKASDVKSITPIK